MKPKKNTQGKGQTLQQVIDEVNNQQNPTVESVVKSLRSALGSDLSIVSDVEAFGESRFKQTTIISLFHNQMKIFSESARASIVVEEPCEERSLKLALINLFGVNLESVSVSASKSISADTSKVAPVVIFESEKNAVVLESVKPEVKVADAEPEVVEPEAKVADAEPEVVEPEAKVAEAEPEAVKSEAKVAEAEPEAVKPEAKVVEAKPEVAKPAEPKAKSKPASTSQPTRLNANSKAAGAGTEMTEEAVAMIYASIDKMGMSENLALLGVRDSSRPNTVRLLDRNQGYRLNDKINKEDLTFWRKKLNLHMKRLIKAKRLPESFQYSLDQSMTLSMKELVEAVDMLPLV